MNLFVLKFFIPMLMMHPVHVSLTNIEWNKNKNSFEITLKFFKDDFSKIINSETGVFINTQDEKLEKAEREAVCKYINKNFSINWCNSFDLSSIVSKEIDDLAVWYHLSIPINKKSNVLLIKNNFLLDLYSDQTNLLIYSDDNQELSEILNKNKNSLEITCK